MDRRRAAGALLALAACIATATAAPTASSNHTALDLFDGHNEGCYYNFRHYAEGDRIMTNEPCLNCTCHNRMLMCYLRVCPFTKAIGQDCTVEKRADQCCPIVTCPDVPVDLLTSTSTSSPAEYGGTGVGHVDNYGCTINGKYLPEGAKVPQTPGKPCEHCYCIRNMTTCVMQECTLHVDGCTPIYAKDVCCPIRYFCDHPDEEMPALDDMTTTVRPTPGFLLTTTTTEEPTTLPVKRDCVEGDEIYPDGALIKTEKPCEHCYCMKGDIVCVVQECGTPMENEGKNCTSLPPREGQCCPDTYICEGDEGTSTVPHEDLTTVPPRKSGVAEGSGYRHTDEDEPYTEIPTSEPEGSGDEDVATSKPVEFSETPGSRDEDKEMLTTPIMPSYIEETTEPDKGLNTVPSDEDVTEIPKIEKTTPAEDRMATVPSQVKDETTEPSIEEKTTTSRDDKLPKIEDVTGPSDEIERTTTDKYDIKLTEPSVSVESETVASEISKETTTVPDQPMPDFSAKVTEPSVTDEEHTTSHEELSPTISEEPTTQPTIAKETIPSDVSDHKYTTELPVEEEQGMVESTLKPTAMAGEDILIPLTTEPTIISEQDVTSIRATEEESTDAPVIKTTAAEETLQETEFVKLTTRREFVATTEPISQTEDESVTEAVPKETAQPIATEAPLSIDVSSADTVAPILPQEDKITTPEVSDLETSTQSTEPTTESFMELATFAHATEKESAITEATEKISEGETTTTLNPEENEIGEGVPSLPSPDHIPGEGDCLLNGITYTNNTVVPSTNKCHTGCKCVSSIVKCDPIMCSPPPDYMDNCQVAYDTPDSCCPTYVCDHSKETIPPQPHSQMSGTESPTVVPETECQDGQCEIDGEKPSDEKPAISTDCSEQGCASTETPAKSPEEPEQCAGENCQAPACADGKCDAEPTAEQPQACESPEKCKEVTVPQSAPCDGESCAVDKEQPEPCEGESCAVGTEQPKPCEGDSCAVDKEQPEPCEGESCAVGTEQSKPCEGESCTVGTEQPKPCEGDSCAVGTEQPKPCEGDSCAVDKEQPEPCEGESCTVGTEQPKLCEGDFCAVDKEQPKPCEGESCTFDTEQPKPCEGESCAVDREQSKPCEGESCAVDKELLKPCEGENCESKPVEVIPKVCTSEEECKETKLPEAAAPPCQGDSCVLVNKFCTEESGCAEPQEQPCEGDGCEPKPEVPSKEEQKPEVPVPCEGESCPTPSDCTGDKCVVEPVPTLTPPSQAGEICSDENECKKPVEELCVEEDCRRNEQEGEQMIPGTEPEQERQTEQPESHTTSDVEVTKLPEKEIVTETPEEITTLQPELPLPDGVVTASAPAPQTEAEYPATSVTEKDEKEVLPTIAPRVTESPELIDEHDESSTQRKDQENEVTKAPEDEMVTTLVPLKPAEEQQTKLPESDESLVTTAPLDETMTEIPQVTSAPHDEVQTESEPPVTSVPSDEEHTEVPELSITEQPEDDTQTKLPESVTSLPHDVAQTTLPETPVTRIAEDDSQTELPVTSMPQDEAHSQSPEPPVTIIAEDEQQTEPPPSSDASKPYDETHPELPESPVTIGTVSETSTTQHEPAATIPPVDESSVPSKPQSEVSEPHPTTQYEVPEVTTTISHDEAQTELPKAPATNIPQQEFSTEVPQTEKLPEGETYTKTPESPTTSAAEDESPTKQPESLVPELYTSAPQEESQTYSPESPVITPDEEKATEKPETPFTSAEHDETRTGVPELPITSGPYEITTEPSSQSTQQPLYEPSGQETSAPELPDEPKQPEIPTVEEEEIITKAPEPNVSVTTAAEETQPDDKLATTKPEQTQPNDEITTEKADIPVTPEPVETVTEHVPLDTTIPEIGSKATEQPEISQTDAPLLPTTQEIASGVPVVISSEIQTDSPLSLVTRQEPDATTIEPHISEPEETPVTKKPDEPITEEDKTEKPERPSPEEPFMPFPAVPMPSIPIEKEPEPEILPTSTTRPETESPLVDEQESFPEKEPAKDEKSTTETPATSLPTATEAEKEDIVPIPQETETPYVPSESPVETVPDITTKGAEEQATEAPAYKPEEPDTATRKPSPEEMTIEPEVDILTTSAFSEEHPTEPASVASETPANESATDAQKPYQAETSTPEFLTEKPSELATDKPIVDESASISPELENEPVSTNAPDEFTVSPFEAKPTESTEQQPAKQPEMDVIEPSKEITPPKEDENKYEEPQTNVPVVIVPDEEEKVPQEPEPVTPAKETPLSTESPEAAEEFTKQPERSDHRTSSETTPYLVELEEHTHKMDEETSSIEPSEEPTTSPADTAHEPEVLEVAPPTSKPPAEGEVPTEAPSQEEAMIPSKTTIAPSDETPEKQTETAAAEEPTTGAPSLLDKFGDEFAITTKMPEEKQQPTTAVATETEPPSDLPEKDVTFKPLEDVAETSAPEEVLHETKATTTSIDMEFTTQSPIFDKFTKPQEKPSEAPTLEPEVPSELQPTDEIPSPEDDTFPPTGGYGQEPDYGEEDQAFGPGTCRYGGKVYVSAQQIPRDDPCDFCFCFRSDIICLQQSCPPPIHGCHEEPIQGFCCPRYECPVAMATTLNVTTTTTTTTTTLPPHFLPHAYKGAAQRRGCQIKGHTYKVGEVVRASSGPCLHCTCGGDGQMKCDPKACTPEPMLRQMIAAAVSAKRRR